MSDPLDDARKMLETVQKNVRYPAPVVFCDGLTYVRGQDGKVTVLSWCCESECFDDRGWWVCKACGAKKHQ